MEILHQIRDKLTDTEIWAALCDLFENKVNKNVKAHTIRRLPEKDVQHPDWAADLVVEIDDIDMIEMMLESLPTLTDFESLKSSICYTADTSSFTPTKVREINCAAAARQVEFRGKGGGDQRGGERIIQWAVSR
jgi:hypothetical protein